MPRDPTQLPETFQKFRMANLSAGRVCAYPCQQADEANSLALLRARDERPRGCAAEQRVASFLDAVGGARSWAKLVKAACRAGAAVVWRPPR